MHCKNYCNPDAAPNRFDSSYCTFALLARTNCLQCIATLLTATQNRGGRTYENVYSHRERVKFTNSVNAGSVLLSDQSSDVGDITTNSVWRDGAIKLSE